MIASHFWAVYFSSAQPYNDWLERHATAEQKQRWGRSYAGVQLTAAQQALVAGWTREMHLLCLAGAWCGDCVHQCPHLQRIAEANPLLRLRFLDRDEQPELRDALGLCGGKRVPMVVFLSEDDTFCGLYGDRTLSTYRRLAGELAGAACPTGLVPPAQDADAAVLGDWLHELERIQLMLRLSHRLRAKHKD